MRSILQKTRRCLLCGSVKDLERHHVMFGPYRAVSEKEGLTVWLCPLHHRGNRGVHMNRMADLTVKKWAEAKYVSIHGKQRWMERFGRDYECAETSGFRVLEGL